MNISRWFSQLSEVPGLVQYFIFVVKNRLQNKPLLAFELVSLGEWPFIHPLLNEFSKKQSAAVLLAWHDKSFQGAERLPLLSGLSKKTFLTKKKYIRRFPWVNIYITSSQFSSMVPDTYSICIFHGQPSKGITFNKKMLENFDEFFFYGSLHRRAWDIFIKKTEAAIEYSPKLTMIGHTKLDALLNNRYERKAILDSLGLDSALKTVLYAPAFNEHATLRTIGRELIQCLKSIDNINVIVKLAPDSIMSRENFYATGGIDWKKTLQPLAGDHLAIAEDLDANPLLAASDIMVTDVSGIAYDFLVLGKPVIYYDCPQFYRRCVPAFDPNITFAECLAEDTINAGRKYGHVVGTLAELKKAVVCFTAGASRWPDQTGSMVGEILKNPGRATEAAVARIEELLAGHAKSKRPLSERSQ